MTILAQLTAAGVHLAQDADQLVVLPQTPLNDDQLAYLRDHKAELMAELAAERKRRRDEVLMMLADHPGLDYAFTIADASTDPVIIAIGIRDLATFEMTIPANRYNPFRILRLFDRR